VSGLEGRGAVITGAARGIGRATAVALAREGADVAAIDVAQPIEGNPQTTGTQEELAETARAVEALGRRCLPIEADVRRYAEMEGAMRAAVDEFGGLGIVIANAGIALHAPLERMTEEQWRLVLDVNLTGTFNTVRAAAPHLIERRWGRIVAVSSVGGRAGTPGVAAYSSSKWGQISLVKTAALELGGYGITANAVCPTSVDTPLFRSDAQYRDMVPNLYEQETSFKEREEAVKRMMSTQVHALPVPWVDPEDIANAIEFLVSEKARYISGEVLDVAAGSNAHHMG
jgi:SDR family mycofactocin-dependent oxidoreductase